MLCLHSCESMVQPALGATNFLGLICNMVFALRTGIPSDTGSHFVNCFSLIGLASPQYNHTVSNAAMMPLQTFGKQACLGKASATLIRLL